METLEQLDIIETSVSRDANIEQLYEQVFPIVAKFVSNAGGSFDDAKDVFHDALIIFLEKKTEDVEQVIKSDKAYILGIAKHLWIKKYKFDAVTVPLNGMEMGITLPDDFMPSATDKRLLNFLKIAGKRCMDLLRAFYFQQSSITEMATELGYSNEHSVSVQKYKCLEKVRTTVKQKSLTYDDLAE